jgi:hypothetical protein
MYKVLGTTPYSRLMLDFVRAAAIVNPYSLSEHHFNLCIITATLAN